MIRANVQSFIQLQDKRKKFPYQPFKNIRLRYAVSLLYTTAILNGIHDKEHFPRMRLILMHP